MQQKTLYRAESAISIACAALALLSALWPDWIEFVSGLAPDAGDGSTEWGLVAVFAVAALVSGVLARQQWRRLRTAQQARP